MEITFALAIATAVSTMTVGFLISLRTRNYGVADIAWGAGFILIAIVTYLQNPIDHPRQILTMAMVSIWGARLATYIYIRNRNKAEDWRYQKLRSKFIDYANLQGYFQVFLLQAILMVFIATSIIFINFNPNSPLGLLDFIGITAWALGFMAEFIADLQLYKFKQDPSNSGKIITTGIWKYSRHPNYFGEVLMWWGLFAVAASVPYGYLAIISPLIITYLILFVSGVPMLESRYANSKEFQEYKSKTSAFIPWFPSQ